MTHFLKKLALAAALLLGVATAGFSQSYVTIWNSDQGTAMYVIGPYPETGTPAWATYFHTYARVYSGGYYQVLDGSLNPVSPAQWLRTGTAAVNSTVELVSSGPPPSPSPEPAASPPTLSFSVTGGTIYVGDSVSATATANAGSPNSGNGKISTISGSVSGPPGTVRTNTAYGGVSNYSYQETWNSVPVYTDNGSPESYNTFQGYPWDYLYAYYKQDVSVSQFYVSGTQVGGPTYTETRYASSWTTPVSVDLSFTPTQAGTYTISANINGSVSGSTSVTVVKRNQAGLSLSASTPQTYGTSQTLSTSGGSGSGGVSYAIVAQSAAGVATLSGATLTANTGTGWVDVQATKAGDSTYNATTSNTVRVNFQKTNQAALSLGATSPQTYNTSQTLSTSGGSGSGGVSYAIVAQSAAGVATLSGTTLTANTGTGWVDVQVTKATDSNYNAATSSTVRITFQKANQTAPGSITPTSLNSGGSFSAATFSAGSGSRIGSASWEYRTTAGGAWSALSGSVSTPAPGNHLGVRVTYAGDSNWNSSTSAEQVITIINTSQAPLNLVATTPQTYGTVQTLSTTGGSGTGAVTYAIVGQSAAGVATVSGSSLTANTGTGWADVQATKAGDATYSSINSNTVRVNFQKANQAVPASITPASLTYGGNFNSGTFSAGAGTRAGSATWEYRTSSSGAWTALTASNVAIPGAATYLGVRVTYAGDANYNSSTSAEQIVTINKADQTITFGALAGKTYGDAAFTVSATASSGLSPTYSIVSGPATIAGNTVTITGAGTVVVRASQAGNTNYNAAPNVDQSFAVAKASQTVAISPTSQTVLTGGSITFTASGGQNGYTWGGTSGATGSGTTNTVSFASAGSFTVTVQSPASANYNASNTATATITVQDPPTIAISGSGDLGAVFVSGGTPLTSTATITITNTGDQTLNITNVTAGGDFTVTAYNGGAVGWPKSIAPDGSATITVTFDATVVGTRTATLTITNNSTNNPSATVSLTGVGNLGGSLSHSWSAIRTL